ncbi:MAG: sulfite exporter TauE/SafE family protein [Pseudomonadales bacterium]|nr:sulfite exporter TauE/SafE family protein [Pseudomonadales bacterium]
MKLSASIVTDPAMIIILLLIAVGAAVQTLSGFAMGLIIMGGVTALGLAEIGETAAVVSLISLLNTALALRSTYKHLDWHYVRNVSFALVPALIVGVALLNWLSGNYYEYLKALLGIFIVGAGTLLMLRPVLYEQPTGHWKVRLAGTIAGLMGGMYSAGGAPLAYLMYRQPLDVRVVRASLLAMFAVSTAGRAVVTAIDGQLDQKILTLAAISVPVVIVVTVSCNRISHRVPDQLIRKMVFILLIILGGFLVSSVM